MNQKKRLLFIMPILLATLLSCNNDSKRDSEPASSSIATPSTETAITDSAKASDENNIDNKTSTEKLKYLQESNLFAAAKDTKCDVCDKRCCSPCLQNGDYKLCVQTRFENCSICNHASNKHSAVDH